MLDLDICVLLTTLHRPDGLRRVLQSLADTAPGLKVMCATDADDKEARSIALSFDNVFVTTCPESRKGPAYAWNCALSAAPQHGAYVMAADDLIFQPGWLEATLKALESISGSGMVGFNDGRNKNGSVITHYLLTRDFIANHNGGVMCCPHYRTWGPDTETTDRARKVKKLTWARNAMVLHDWRGDQPDADETYKAAAPFHGRDKQTYLKRKQQGFPNDFPPIIRGWK